MLESEGFLWMFFITHISATRISFCEKGGKKGVCEKEAIVEKINKMHK
jgi:hypothetical protein